MPYYFMRDTPLQALEQLMMSQPGQKPRGGGIYRSPFRYTPEDVACEYCQNYVRKHPCRLCECTCLDERIEAGVLELNEFVRDCFVPSMGPQFRKRMHQQLRERNPQFFLSNAHRRRWTYWRERCWRLSDRNKAALFLLTAYESLWRRMVWKCGNDGFDFQNVRLRGIEPELYSVYCPAFQSGHHLRGRDARPGGQCGAGGRPCGHCGADYHSLQFQRGYLPPHGVPLQTRRGHPGRYTLRSDER